MTQVAFSQSSRFFFCFLKVPRSTCLQMFLRLICSGGSLASTSSAPVRCHRHTHTRARVERQRWRRGSVPVYVSEATFCKGCRSRGRRDTQPNPPGTKRSAGTRQRTASPPHVLFGVGYEQIEIHIHSAYVHYSCYSGNCNPLFLIYHMNYDEACLFISALVKPTKGRAIKCYTEAKSRRVSATFSCAFTDMYLYVYLLFSLSAQLPIFLNILLLFLKFLKYFYFFFA